MTLVARISKKALAATLIIDMHNCLMKTLIIEFFLHVFGNWNVVEPWL